MATSDVSVIPSTTSLKEFSPSLTAQELDVMSILWDRGQATVRDVYEELRAHRPLAYTKVLRILGVLEGKQHVTKVTGQDRAFHYQPLSTKEEAIESVVTDFVARAFNGSAKDLVEHMVRTGEISREELVELSRLPD